MIVRQRLALEILHHHEGPAGVAAQLERRDDVGMSETNGRQRLADEAALELFAVLGEQPDDDRAIGGIGRAVERGVAPSPERILEPVSAERGRDLGHARAPDQLGIMAVVSAVERF